MHEQGELSFEDLDKLMPDDVAHILEWLTEKVDALSTKLKVELKEEEVRPFDFLITAHWALVESMPYMAFVARSSTSVSASPALACPC